MLTRKMFGLAAIVPTVLLGGAAMASATSAPVTAKSCSVSVDRSQPAGTFNVTRQTMRNGSCVCYIYAGQGAGADKAIAGVTQGGRCGNSAGLAVGEAAQDAGAAPMDAAPASTGGGMSATTVGIGVAAVAAVAGGVIAATHGDDSAGG